MNDYRWSEGLNCAVTVCDADGVILYMNRKAREMFASHGDLIGRNLYDCHSAQSAEMIHHMLATGESNAYTIEKNGVHKIIYQSPWRNPDGSIGGLVEFSMVTPANLPHHIRQ